MKLEDGKGQILQMWDCSWVDFIYFLGQWKGFEVFFKGKGVIIFVFQKVYFFCIIKGQIGCKIGGFCGEVQV